LNGRVDDGFLKIPLPPGRGAINFDVPARDMVGAAVEGKQDPNTLIFLHTGGFEEHTVKDATTGQVFEEEDIEECDKCFKAVL
jgi:hypothetical protein